MGTSIFTAAMLWCLIGQPHSFASCEVMNSKMKFMTEEQCWATLNAQMARLLTETSLGEKYEPVDAKCFNWLDAESKL
tara:strand:+ start:1022 stop:1255 length:234 start_codon:yes stop_codon:yes gene_type:complete